MLNFKKVLLGECCRLDVREQSQWPELGSFGHGILSGRSSGNDFPTFAEIENSETVNTLHNNVVSSLQASSSKNLSSDNDFPKLTDSFEKHLGKRGKECYLQSQSDVIKQPTQNSTKINREKNPKFKKSKKSPSKAHISVDINVMLKVSLSLAERRRQRKRMKRSLPLQEELSAKSTVGGNKLDSDCPIRHRGKKRPQKRRQVTSIKRGFQWAAQKPKRNLPASYCFIKRMNRLRQIILAGMAAEQDIDGLVTNLGRLAINDTHSEQSLTIDSLQAAKSIIHTKNFRPYCNHLMRLSLKNKACELITTLRTYQDRVYHRDPINSKAKRRYVCGCRETRKFLRAETVKLLFIANNLAVNNGMPPIMQELLKMAQELNLPVIYAGSASDLGYWSLKKRSTSVIAVLNYEGAEKLYREVMSELQLAYKDYQLLVEKIHHHLQHYSNGAQANINKEGILQQVEQIRESIISKLTLSS